MKTSTTRTARTTKTTSTTLSTGTVATTTALVMKIRTSTTSATQTPFLLQLRNPLRHRKTFEKEQNKSGETKGKEEIKERR